MNGSVFENIITSKEDKYSMGDEALAVLVNHGLLKMEKECLTGIIIEFAYLFKRPDGNTTVLLKLVTPERKDSQKKTYYLGTQDNKLILLNSMFTEETFRKVQSDMFLMHKVDVENRNINDYLMQLY